MTGRLNEVRGALAPLGEQFRSTIRQSASGRSAHGKPRAARRAVVAAIDRVADAFIAIDTVTDAIGDEPGEMGDNLPAVNLGTAEAVVSLAATSRGTCASMSRHCPPTPFSS